MIANTMIANIGLFILYVCASAYGLFRLKTANGVVGPDFILGFAAYGAGFLIWYYVLTRMPLSTAFPIAAGSLIVATQIVGYRFLSEPLALSHLAGIALILAGIGVIFANA